MNRNYSAVAERARNRCEYCRAPEQVFNFAFEVKHIVPRSANGSDALENLALACESCNLYKSSSLFALDRVTGEGVALFNPRRQAWEQHFRSDAVAI